MGFFTTDDHCPVCAVKNFADDMKKEFGGKGDDPLSGLGDFVPFDLD